MFMFAAPRRARYLLVLLVLSASLVSMPIVQAQENGLPDARYASPTWGYVIRWDSSGWDVAREDSVSGTDTLLLEDGLGNAVTFIGETAFGGDAGACLEALLQGAQSTPGATDFAIAQDALGDPYEWSSPEQSYVVFQITVPDTLGEPADYAVYAECQTLVPGEAVFQRIVSGPPDRFEASFEDIAATVEGVFLPASAWISYFPDDPTFVSAGIAPLRDGEERIDAAFALDSADQPHLLVGLETEAGETRVVTFENVSGDPVTVAPGDVTLTLYALTGEAPDQNWPQSAFRWEDAATGVEGERTLAPGERATLLLDFAAGDLSAFTCDVLPTLLLEYQPIGGELVEFADRALPESLQGCLDMGLSPSAAGRPILRAPLPQGITRETLFAEELGTTDVLGRIPLARLTFAPGTEIAADVMAGPLAGLIESGTFEIVLGEMTVTLPAEEYFSAEDGATFPLRNIGDDAGSVLVLPLTARDDWGATLAETLPPGITFEILFPDQDLLNRLSSRQFTVDRVVLEPGATLDPSQRTGETPEYAAILVERGAVAVVAGDGTASSGKPVTAGDTLRVPAGTVIQTASDQPAEILVIQVSEDAAT